MTGTEQLNPDLFVIGKSIGGGIPCGAYGISEELADRVTTLARSGTADIDDVGGVGGTLAGNALSTAAMRATLSQVLTDDAFGGMIELSTRYADSVAATIKAAGMPWSITQLGARAEFRYASPAPRTGNASAAAADPLLDEYFHLYLANRGVLLTPFHNMALMSPATRSEDVALHCDLFADAVNSLVEQLASRA